jgi:spore germination protein
MKLLLSTGAGLFIGASLVMFALFSFAKLTTEPSLSQIVVTATPLVVPTKQPDPIVIRTWFAYWDETLSLKRLRMVADHLSGISPVLYYFAEDGTLVPYALSNKDEVLAVIQAHDIPMTPMIGDDFDEEAVHALLYDEKVQEKFLDEIVLIAQKQGYRGWDIDIEMLKADDREEFTSFVKKVSEELHSNNMTLTMTLFAKDAADTFTGARAQDYEAIAQYSDTVQLMAYNYNNSFTDPGGQTPASWYRSVLAYAKETIPEEKLVIGLSAHGQEWRDDKVVPYTFLEMQMLIDQFDAEVSYDAQELSFVAQFNDDDDKRTIWFENERSLHEKIDIAREEFGLTRFVLWRLGAEDSILWEELLQKNSEYK